MRTARWLLPLVLGVAAAQNPGMLTPTGNLTKPRELHTATLLTNGKVLIAGGFVAVSGPVWACAELYDPSTGAFTPTGDMTMPRYAHTATLLPNGNVLIAGGRTSDDSAVATAELYDASTGVFTATGNMTAARSLHTATLLNNGKVLIAGAELTAEPSAELYDPYTGTFTSTGDMTEPGADTATLLPDGKVLVTRAIHAELYDCLTGVFARTGDIIDPNSGWRPAAALLASGKVLIAGGSLAEFGSSASAELYDPATGAFAATGRMTAGIDAYAAAVLLPEGRVLIAGKSQVDAGSPGTAELYDPVSATFSAPFGSNSVEGHAATLLPDGAVLLSGGWVCCGSSTIATAEIYLPEAHVPSTVLISPSGDGQGQGAIQHADTYQLVSPDNPAVAGEILAVYCKGLVDASVIPPQVSIGGRVAEVVWFGSIPGFAGLNQINIRVPAGIASGDAVPVRLFYLGRPSNAVTIGVS